MCSFQRHISQSRLVTSGFVLQGPVPGPYSLSGHLFPNVSEQSHWDFRVPLCELEAYQLFTITYSES